MPHSCRVVTVMLLAGASWCARAEDERDAAPVPPAARKVVEEAEKSLARNRKAFEAANEASLAAAEKALKEVLTKLTKDGKLDEALATRTLLATLRRDLVDAPAREPGRQPTEAANQRPVARMTARPVKVRCNEQFGFADQKRVAESWEFDGQAQDYQLGSGGITMRNGGMMRSRVGLVGDFEIGVVMNSVWGGPELRIAGAVIPFVQPNKVITLARKGNQLFVNQGGERSTVTIPEDHVDQPAFLAITNGDKPLEVGTVAIKGVKEVVPEDEGSRPPARVQ